MSMLLFAKVHVLRVALLTLYTPLYVGVVNYNVRLGYEQCRFACCSSLQRFSGWLRGVKIQSCRNNWPLVERLNSVILCLSDFHSQTKLHIALNQLANFCITKAHVLVVSVFGNVQTYIMLVEHTVSELHVSMRWQLVVSQSRWTVVCSSLSTDVQFMF